MIEPRHVLVVDDDPLVRLALHQALGDSGCIVTEATDARSAAALLSGAAPPFDVVLLDCQMPDSTGLALLATVRTLAPASVVIMMTAHPTPAIVAGAERLGAERVMQKPMHIDELCRLVTDGRR